MFKILIVDDEASMRFILRKALEKLQHIEIVGEATRGDEAVQLVEQLEPDAVFMDVDMPTLDGVEAAKLIVDIQPSTMIVFLTGHHQYMEDAFALYAFDYILKPFKIDRIKQTVEKMEQLKLGSVLDTDNEVTVSAPLITDEIFLKNKDGMAVISYDDIILIQRENRTTTLLTKEDRFVTTQTLSELEAKLPKDLFLRSHKSYIINISKITRITPYGRWTYVVKLRDIKDDALLTKANAEILEERFAITIT